jgi:predicted dehydrogenase
MAAKHRILVVGVGSIGERHLRCFQKTGRADVALCEPNAVLREKIADTYRPLAAHDKFDCDTAGAYDAVVICTPAHLHVGMAMDVVKSGRHLLLEKPVSISLDGVDHLLKAIDASNRAAGVAYVYRVNPVLQAMKKAINEGKVGRPTHMVVVAGQHFPTYRPAYREIYYTKHATGGGAIQDALTHLVNAGEYLLGPISRVCCDAQHQVLEGVTVEDTVNVLARHGDVMGSYAMNQFQAPNEVSFTVHGDEGSVRFDVHRNTLGIARERGGAWQEQAFGPTERDDIFVAQANAFLDAVEGKAPPLCTMAEGVQTLRVNLALLFSAAEQRWVSIP